MRDAQSLLEQILSYAVPAAGEEKGKVQIEENLLQDILGIAERKVLYDLSEAVSQGNAKRCVDLVANVMNRGLDITRLSRELVEHFRNLLIVRLAQDQNQKAKDHEFQSSEVNQLLDLPDQEIEDLGKQVSGLSVDTLMDYFRFMAEGDGEVARSSYPRFALETTLVRLVSLPKTMPVTEVLERLEMLERKLSGGGNPQSLPVASEETHPIIQGEEKVPDASLPSSVGDHDTEIWDKFVAFVMREKKGLVWGLSRNSWPWPECGRQWASHAL